MSSIHEFSKSLYISYGGGGGGGTDITCDVDVFKFESHAPLIVTVYTVLHTIVHSQYYHHISLLPVKDLILRLKLILILQY